MNIDRRVTDTLNFGIDTEYVTDLHRADEMHTVERHRDGTALRSLAGADSRGDIHLRYHPATKNVACRVLVCGHCDVTRGQFTLRFVRHGFCAGKRLLRWVIIGRLGDAVKAFDFGSGLLGWRCEVTGGQRYKIEVSLTSRCRIGFCL